MNEMCEHIRLLWYEKFIYNSRTEVFIIQKVSFVSAYKAVKSQICKFRCFFWNLYFVTSILGQIYR